MYKTIVWATDGSEHANHALEHVRELARVHGSRVVAVHANEVLAGRFGGSPLYADEPELRESIERQVADLRQEGFNATLEIPSGDHDTATLIVRAAEEVDADLIVVGTRGHGAVAAALTGSVARALCHNAGRPLLVVPPPQAVRQPVPADHQLTTA